MHVYFCRDELEEDVWNKKLRKGLISCTLRLMNGEVWSQANTGSVSPRRSASPKAWAPTRWGSMRRIKQAFDPNGILNPHKVFV